MTTSRLVGNAMAIAMLSSGCTPAPGSLSLPTPKDVGDRVVAAVRQNDLDTINALWRDNPVFATTPASRLAGWEGFKKDMATGECSRMSWDTLSQNPVATGGDPLYPDSWAKQGYQSYKGTRLTFTRLGASGESASVGFNVWCDAEGCSIVNYPMCFSY